MEAIIKDMDLKVKMSNRQILSIALPITLAILIPQINMLINSIFLGTLNIRALGNAGITGVFYLIFAVAGHGLNNSLQSVLSRYAGASQPEMFKTVMTQAIRISLQFALIGILFTWIIAPLILQQVADPISYPEEISFLRIRIFGLPFLYLFQMGNAFLVATLNSRLLIIGFVVEAFVNILLDYLLIFGHGGMPTMGFNGAAVASVIAEITGFVVVLLVLNKTKLTQDYGLFKSFSYDKKTSRQILRIATPLVLQFMISVTTWLVFFFLVESLHDETAKAISNTMRNVFGLTGIFVWAFSSTANAMVSNFIGQKQEKTVIPVIFRIMLWSSSLCFLMCALTNLFPTEFFGLFNQNKAFTKEAIPVLRMVSLGIMAMSIGNIWLNGLTGIGKTKINLMIEIVAIVAYLSYTWYFVKMRYVSLAMAWSNELVYWLIIFALSFGYIISGKWRSKKKHTT